MRFRSRKQKLTPAFLALLLSSGNLLPVFADDPAPAAPATDTAATPAAASPPAEAAPVTPVTSEVAPTPTPAAATPEGEPAPQHTAAVAPQHPTAAARPTGPLPAHPSQKPVTLQGRIEEICSQPIPQLKLKWKAMTPQRDTRLDGKVGTSPTAISGNITQQSFPIDYRGTWGGQLTVYLASFDPACWQFDADEANKESKLLKPGIKGNCQVTFYQNQYNRIQSQPCEVVFQATMRGMDDSMRRQLGPMASMMDPSTLANMSVPYMFALHLGNLTDATGVTGNRLQGQLVRNDLRELKPGVIEQVVVNHMSDKSATSGKELLSYGESVLRFTRLNSNQLYLQAASVNYRNDGKFLNKVILYGTLDRGGGSAYPGMPAGLPMQMQVPQGGYGQGYGGQQMPNPNGLGGAGGIGGAMQQLQQLFQQMNNQ